MNFLLDENGQGMVEYALIVGLIAIVAVVALVFLGPIIREKFGVDGNSVGNVL